MSGASAIGGYTYQKDYAAFRILSSEALQLLDIDHDCDCVESFVVEGPSADGGLAWDIVWKTAGGGTHVRECKDTEIQKSDRIKFYRRIRKEVANANGSTRLTIGWVTDASKQGNILNHLTGMHEIAVVDSVSTAGKAPNEVRSAQDALSEAVFHLCSEAIDLSAPPPVSLDHALALLREMTIETFREEELSRSVSDLAGSLFEHGVGSNIRNFIQGEFDTVIQKQGEARYSRDEFLAVVGDGELVIRLATTYRDILQFQSAAHRSFEIAGIKWARLPNAPEKTWPLHERLHEYDPLQSRVLVASTGDGKTTSCQQALQLQLQLAIRQPFHVLWFEAGNVSAETAKAIPMLCLLLCGIAPTWIAIDGLDPISPDKHDLWSETLDRMQTIPHLTMLISVRSEVVGHHKWMQDLVTSLGEARLGPLTEEQIDGAFREVQLPTPSNPSLRSCLRNPFLFSVYARTVDVGDMPLEGSGEVEAFNVIEEYWKLRVTSDSPGARGSGDPASSHISKRAAISYLAEQTLCGHELFAANVDKQHVANGIVMLCNESVLTWHTTSRVKWSHAWYREYAIVDHLLGTIPSPSPVTLAHAVCRVSSDHLARDAANGGCKWLIAHPELGNPGDYLQILYENRRELAREVLFDVMDGAERHLTLAALSSPLLIEAIELACQKRATQWAKQVSELPDELFAGVGGPDIVRVVIDYETKVTSSE